MPRLGTGLCHNAWMRFRTGLIIGLGVGYVLGTRAGQERYDQIHAAWQRVRGDEIVGSLIQRTVDLTESPRNAARQAVSDGLRGAGNAIQDRTSGTVEIRSNGHSNAG